jgi:hypothetical protein
MFGRGRHGEATVQDSQYVEARGKQLTANQGDGVLRFRYYDRNNKPIVGATREVDGRIMRGDANGYFTKIDKGVLDFHLELEEQLEDQVDKAMKYAVVSDEMTMRVFNLTRSQYAAVLGPSPTKQRIEGNNGKFDIPETLAKYDARASHLKVLANNSVEFRGGLAKLRIYVKNNLPWLEDDTPDYLIRQKAVPPGGNQPVTGTPGEQ